MQFNSIAFLFGFLPVFLLVYFCIRQELRQFSLVLFSLIFYGLTGGENWWWVAVLSALLLVSFGLNRGLAGKPRGWLLAFGLTLMAGVLVFFKLWVGGRWLPAGMSFFLFQMTAFMIDIYRGRIGFDTPFLEYAEQILLFPKLLSGPLMDPGQLQSQCRNCQRRFANIREGLLTLIMGLALKVLIANRLGGLFGQIVVVGYENISTPFAWMTLIAWAMQLYFDFYGYSLMAMGLGKMIGYDLPENFLDPYAARSVSEFYRRWHVTLGAWFREYLYIPLGGNRCGNLRTLLNLAVVWLFTGLWHGVGGNYLLWAMILFFYVMNERLWLGKLLKKTKVLCHVYTVLAILISWIPFAVGDWQNMITYAGRLIGLFPGRFNPQDVIIWGREYWPILLAGVVLATPWPRKLCRKLKDSPLADVVCFALFWVVVFFIATSAQDPFLYFQY